MSFFSYSRGFEGLPDIFLRDAKRYLPFMQFINTVMTGGSALSHAQRETLAAYVSSLNRCRYCVDAHSGVLNALGEDQAVTDAVTSLSIEQLDDKMQSFLQLAKKLSQEPYKITRADIEKACQAGWSEQAVEDAVNVICVFEYVNRLVDAFGVRGSQSHFARIGGLAAESGYAPLVQMIQQKADAE